MSPDETEAKLLSYLDNPHGMQRRPGFGHRGLLMGTGGLVLLLAVVGAFLI